MIASAARRLLTTGILSLGLLVSCGLLTWVTSAQADGPTLDLANLSAAQEEQMLKDGQVTSVQLVQAYLSRIAAINKAGPGLNAVTQINPDALKEAAQADQERAAGQNLGPAMGVPILLKDIVNSTPMYTSAGDWALRGSYAPDSGVAKELRAHGVVILGKAGLSEWANSFGSQPSGFSNLTGQVLNANDSATTPSGSSSGSAAAAASSLSALTIGTETSGSIISPATAQEDVGLRPTVGLVPGYGIAPILASQDTAGPIERTVTDAAMTLQSIAEVPGSDPTANQEYLDLMGPSYNTNGDIPASPFTKVPNYMSALTPSFVNGMRIGYNAGSQTGGTTLTPGTPLAVAFNALQAAGAIMVPDTPTTVNTSTLPALPTGYEAHATIDEYYQGLGAGAPVQSLAQEVAVDNANPQEAAKDGNSAHANEAQVDDTPGGANQQQYQTNLPQRKAAFHGGIDAMINTPNGCTAGSAGCSPVAAVLGFVPQGPAAGYPEIAIPMGYTATQRRPQAVDINGGAYDERNLIGIGYVLEQATQLRQTPGNVDPAMYRCAHTVPAEPFASRGHCNPDYQSIMNMLGGTAAVLPFSLEAASAQSLEAKMTAGTLTSQQLVKAELYRIAVSNAQGPAIQALRRINPGAISEAAASDQRRASGGARGPLEGIPVLVDDTMDVTGLATSGGSIALQDNLPAADATLVAKLKAAGAIILGDANATELGGQLDGSMPQGYSSLGGQVLLPSDTNKNAGGSSGGSTSAVSAGFAPLAVGMESTTDPTAVAATANPVGNAGMIATATNAGLAALKPTVGLVSRTGILPVAKSQDSPGPVGQTVTDVATELGILAGPDASDSATASQPATLPDYTAGLSSTALSGKSIAVLSTSTTPGSAAPYPTAVSELGTLGASATAVTPGAATSAPSIVPYEFHRDLDAYLSATPNSGANSLQQVIDYNNANATEGLKFGQNGLIAAQAVNTNDPSTTSTYQSNLSQGQSDDRAVIDTILSGGPYSAIMVPSGSSLVGIADRAGYPVLTVPAGFVTQNSNQGGDPLGVVFIGTKYSEAALLDYGYALEQGLNARLTGPSYMNPNGSLSGFSGVPSETNQSMWRCVTASAFSNPYDCNAGDLQSTFCIDGNQAGCASGGTTTTPPGGGTTTTPGGGGGTTKPAILRVDKITAGQGLIYVELSCTAGGGNCVKAKLSAVVIEEIRAGKLIAVVAKKKGKTLKKTVVIASGTVSLSAGATRTFPLTLDRTGRALLAKTKHGLATRATVSFGGKTLRSRVITVEKLPARKK